MHDFRSRLASLTQILWLLTFSAALLVSGCEKEQSDEGARDDASTSPSCPDGEVAVGDHCCFHGQTWSTESQTCEGVPSCPGDTSYGDACPPPVLEVERRLEWLSLACDEGEQPACGVLSGHYLTGNGTTKDSAKAKSLAERACDAEGWSGCNTLGLIYIKGDATTQDTEKAHEFFSRACEHKDGEACKNLALMYARGVGVEEDQKRALTLYRRSCELDFQPACKVVERMKEMDRNRARDVLDSSLEACDQGDQGACARAGEILIFGSAGEPDVQRGLALLDKSCGSGVGAACRVLATAFYAGKGVPKDAGRARIFAERGCALDEFDACNILGLLYMLEPGPGVDIGKARDILQRACDAENPRACSNLGRAYMMETDGSVARPDRARDALTYACEHEISDACERLEKPPHNKNPQDTLTKQD